MAVKTSRIKERIKKLFPKVNLSQSRMNALAVKLSKKAESDATDDDLDEIINDFNEIYSFEQIAKEDDRLRTTSKKLKKLQEESEDDDEEEEEESEEEEEDDDEGSGKTKKGKKKSSEKDDKPPKWAQALTKNMEKMGERLDKFESGQTQTSNQSKAEKLLKESEVLKNLPESLQKKTIKLLVFDDDENPIEDQIAELEEDYADFKPADSDSDDLLQKPPLGDKDTVPSEKEIDEIVDNL